METASMCATIAQKHAEAYADYSAKGRDTSNDHINEDGAKECGCGEETYWSKDDSIELCPNCDTDEDTEEEDIQKKITNWLNDKNNNENDLVDFLIDECGIVLKNEEDEEEDEDEEEVLNHMDKKCEDCDKIVKNFYLNNPFGQGNRNCSDCPEFDEDEEEDLDTCGETGRKFDIENPVKGCGIKITEDDENIMLGNISYCYSCGEAGMKEYPEL